jgi:hypothetical protein
MSTSQSAAKMIETRYVWGPNIPSCMEKAQTMCKYGRWEIQGNPAPMTWSGRHGTGVAISRVNDE